MNARIVAAIALLSAAAGLTAVTVRASDPIGVYAVIERIVLEPAEGDAQRVQIWGAFALSDAKSNDTYGPAARGYLYYSCPQGQESVCRKEWADLKASAGKGTGVGFGGRRKPTGRVRKADDKPGSPDVYPIQMGVVRVASSQASVAVIDRIKAALRTR